MNPLGSLIDIVPGIMPLDLQTARTGDYVSLKNAAGCLVVIVKGAGTAADDPDFTLNQATAVAGTSAKALNAIDTVYKKQGAALTAVGTWTKETQTADEVYSADGTSAEEQAVYCFNVDAAQLDVDNGFDCISVDCGDVGTNAQLGTVLYILHGLRYPDKPDALPNSIAD